MGGQGGWVRQPGKLIEAALDLDFFESGDALIRHWLHIEPSNNMDTFIKQTAQAMWLEKRHWQFYSKLWSSDS